MNRERTGSKGVRFRGEELGEERIREVKLLRRQYRGATRRELARQLCQRWDWRQPNGGLSLRACRDLLCLLEERGLIELPAPRPRPGRRRKVTRETTCGEASGEAPESVGGSEVDLRGVVVRPVRRGELGRWRELMARFHYLGDAELVGESLRYVAESKCGWLALTSWNVAAWKSRHREGYIGWDARTKQQRLRFVANNSRFLILPWVRVPHLASSVLAANVRRLSADWVERHGHPILLVETFVDLERFRGTCYRAANWQYLGRTRGMGRRGRGYEEHGQPKGLFVLPLHRRAREILSSPLPRPEILDPKDMAKLSVEVDVNRLPLLGEGDLVEVLKGLSDPRKKRGIRHPLESVLALSVMAALSGMRSYEAIAEWAADVPKDVLRLLRCWCHQAPSEPTFRRVLQSVNAEEVDRAVGAWLAKQKGVRVQGTVQGVALDGKTLRGSGDGDKPPVHLLSAITHEAGVVLAQEGVGEKTNEIKHAASLLQDVDLAGKTVTADAMHTQRDFARFLVEEKKADYVFIVKENQPTLLDDLKTQHDGDFSPSSEND